MKRDIRVYIEDILECITKIEEYTKYITEKKPALGAKRGIFRID